MPSVAMEKTANAVARFNLIGCVALFLYSLIGLGTLCPFCTLYYALSGVAFFLLWKYGLQSWKPDVKVGVFWGVILLIGAFFLYQTTAQKEQAMSQLNTSVVDQYRKLANLGEPTESPYKIHMATEKFADSPIRVSVFSDFECPFCAKVAEQMPALIKRYPKQISIQYFFYPLDNKCNSNIQGSFHQHACDAAMLAACDEKKFLKVHDEIFQGQTKLGDSFLQEIAKKHNLTNCFTDVMKNKVITTINQAGQFNLKSTPTIIVNGKKIEGTIPNNQFFAIFEDILKNGK